MAYKIEKGVPLPDARGRSGWGLSESLRRLEPGESILVTDLPAASIFAIMSKIGKQKATTFTSRTEGSGRRIWRVS